jgi:hypothetical protein
VIYNDVPYDETRKGRQTPNIEASSESQIFTFESNATIFSSLE